MYVVSLCNGLFVHLSVVLNVSGDCTTGLTWKWKSKTDAIHPCDVPSYWTKIANFYYRR